MWDTAEVRYHRSNEVMMATPTRVDNNNHE